MAAQAPVGSEPSSCPPSRRSVWASSDTNGLTGESVVIVFVGKVTTFNSAIVTAIMMADRSRLGACVNSLYHRCYMRIAIDARL